MVKKYFYLIVGLLCVLFAVTHTMNGQATTLPALNNTTIDTNTKNIFTYVWHIIGVENLIFGVGLLIMAFHKNMSRVRFTAWVIISIMVIRWVAITSFTALNNVGALKQLLPDTIAILTVVILLLLGTRVTKKTSNE